MELISSNTFTTFPFIIIIINVIINLITSSSIKGSRFKPRTRLLCWTCELDNRTSMLISISIDSSSSSGSSSNRNDSGYLNASVDSARVGLLLLLSLIVGVRILSSSLSLLSLLLSLLLSSLSSSLSSSLK